MRLVLQSGTSNLCLRPDAQACVYGYASDIDDAQTVLQPAFSGTRGSAPGQDLSRLDDAAVNRAIDRASRLTGRARRARVWAHVDRMISALAPGVPLAWPRLPNVFSADVVPALNDLSASLDLAYTRLRSL